MLSSSARPSPIRSCSSTVQNDSLTCTQTELCSRVVRQQLAVVARAAAEKSHSVSGRVRLSGVKLVASR